MLVGPPVWVVPTGLHVPTSLAALMIPRMPMNLLAGISLLGRTGRRELTSPLARMALPVPRGTLAQTTLLVLRETLVRMALPLSRGTLARIALPVWRETLPRMGRLELAGPLAQMVLPTPRSPMVRTGLAAPTRSLLVGVAKAV